MLEKRLYLLLCAIISTSGFLITIVPEPTFSIWVYHPPEFEFNLGYAKWLVGPCLVLIGLVSFIEVYKKPTPAKKDLYKCISCGKLIELERTPAPVCDTCNSPLEKLEGFFERHPELKDDKK